MSDERILQSSILVTWRIDEIFHAFRYSIYHVPVERNGEVGVKVESTHVPLCNVTLLDGNCMYTPIARVTCLDCIKEMDAA